MVFEMAGLTTMYKHGAYLILSAAVLLSYWLQATSTLLQVYDSLKTSGKVPPEKLARFNHEEGASQLQYMRYLPVARRPATALYIVEQNLDSAVRTIIACTCPRNLAVHSCFPSPTALKLGLHSCAEAKLEGLWLKP